MDTNILKNKYIDDLKYNLLTFWEKAMDKKYGGVFTCYTNQSDTKVSDRKYIWSQGRFLWICCNLQMMQRQGIIQLSENWVVATDNTYQFLNNHALMANNHAVFAVERDGRKIDDQMDISIFADCFYLLGCNAYSQLKKDIEIFEENIAIYHTVKSRIANNDFNSEPYPIPAGYHTHSIPMILLNVAQELYETAILFNHEMKFELLEDMKSLINQILTEFNDGTRILEMVSDNPKNHNTLMSRHLNPGHTLESIWFMIHSMNHLDQDNFDEFLISADQLSENILNIGWDNQYGGLFRYIDKEGGNPVGEMLGTDFELLIKNTWDFKLWWPHSEALYSTLLLYDKTQNKKWLQWYEKIEKYTFNTFPNENKEIGEWVQIRNRQGEPVEKVIALPVKDPFHIIRSYIFMIALLTKKQNQILAEDDV